MGQIDLFKVMKYLPVLIGCKDKQRHLHQLCEDTGCHLDDLLRSRLIEMNDESQENLCYPHSWMMTN